MSEETKTLKPADEAMMREATTAGDLDTTHAAGVLAWRSIWATLDAARSSAIVATLDAARATEAMNRARECQMQDAAKLERAAAALRHLASCGDTLSPQEISDVAAAGLGEERTKYAGQIDPDTSMVLQAAKIAKLERPPLAAGAIVMHAALESGVTVVDKNASKLAKVAVQIAREEMTARIERALGVILRASEETT